MIKVPNGLAELRSTFGNPNDFVVNGKTAAWEKKILTTIALPQVLLYSDGQKRITKITTHYLLAEYLRDTLMLCLNSGIKKEQMLYAGCYNFRTKRTAAAKISTHAWGIAVDINPATNPLGKKWQEGKGMMPRLIIDIFTSRGFVWGGSWSYPDPMHFQYCSGY